MSDKPKIKEKYKKAFWGVFSVVLAAFTVWAVLRQSESVSLKDIFITAVSVDVRWISCAILSTALYILFEGIALCSILKSAGHPRRLGKGVLYGTADIYFSAITPSATGGQPASAYFMMRDKIPGGVTTAVLILNVMMYTISIVVLGIIAMIISPGSFFEFSTVSKTLMIAAFAALTGLSCFFMLILRKGNKVFDVIGKFIGFLGRKKILRHTEAKIEKLHKASEDYSKCSEMVSGRPSVMLTAFFWNLLQRTAQVIVPVFVYMALGGKGENCVMIFAKQCLITVGFNLVPVPGAMGVADYLMIDGFSDLLGSVGATKFEMLSRGITFYTCVSVCGIITLIGYIMGRRKHDRSI